MTKGVMTCVLIPRMSAFKGSGVGMQGAALGGESEHSHRREKFPSPRRASACGSAIDTRHPMAEDPLFGVRNAFHLGHYQKAINEAPGAKVKTDAQRIERDTFIYRAYLAQGNYQLPLDEIKTNAPPQLLAVRALALYQRGDKDGAKQEVSGGGDGIRAIVACTIALLEGNLDEAWRCVHAASALEARSLLAQVLVRMERIDLAEKVVAAMKTEDEDNIVTQLAIAWTGVAAGGADRLHEAEGIAQELLDKYGPTPTLLNLLACANMLQGKFEAAEANLLEALESNAKHPDTLANLIVVCAHLKKTAEGGRFQAQLKQYAPNHAMLQSQKTLEESYARLAERFASA